MESVLSLSFLNRIDYETLILSGMTEYRDDVILLLKTYSFLWSKYHDNIGKIIVADTCNDSALIASYGMFKLARKTKINLSAEDEIRDTTWVHRAIQHNNTLMRSTWFYSSVRDHILSNIMRGNLDISGMHIHDLFTYLTNEKMFK